MVDGGVAQGGLTSMPGTELFAELDDGFVPLDIIEGTGGSLTAGGLHVFAGELYSFRRGQLFVDSTLVKVDSSGVETTVGTFSGVINTRNAIMADNGVVMCIVIPSSQVAYFYDETNGLVEITDSVFAGYQAEATGVMSVAFVDGYFVFNTHESLFVSSLVTNNDGKSFDALDFVKPFLREEAQLVLSVRGELMVFGRDTSKTYSNVGGADFPFQEIPGATIQKGIHEQWAAVEFDNSYFFIGSGSGEKDAVWRGIGGGGVSKISTDYIDRGIADIGTLDEIDAFMIDGRPFIIVRSTGKSQAYDVLSSSIKGVPVWIDWTRDTDNLPSPTTSIVEAYGEILYDTDDRIHQLSSSVGSVYGEGDKPFVFSGSYLQNQSEALIVNRLELVMETGIGSDIEVDPTQVNPVVLMEYSDDGANTWKSAGTREIGRMAHYEKRLVWTRLGRAPTSRIFRFTCNTSLSVNFNRVDISVEAGYRNA